MDKITKTFISEIKGIDEKNFTVEAVVSDETIDRYQEVIKIDAWKGGLNSYKKHGVLLSSHNYGKLTNQIGVAEKIRTEDGKLIAKFKYFVGAGNDEADWGFYLAKQGLAAYSVGFVPKPGGYETASWDDEDVKAGKKPCRTYTAVELLEISQVTVPANPSALQKSLGDSEDDDFLKEYKQKIYNFLIEKGINGEDEEVVITKPETTENYHHVPVPGEEGKHSGHKIRTIKITDGVKGKYCVDDKKVISYMFDKEKYSMDEAKDWVKEHSKDMEDIETKFILDIDETVESVLIDKTLEEILEEKKKKPKGGCKSEEEEGMILEAIENLKKEMSEKLEKIEEKFNKWEEEEKEFLESIEKEEKDVEEIEKKKLEEEEQKKIEEEENYIKQVLSDMNDMLATKFSVQSK